MGLGRKVVRVAVESCCGAAELSSSMEARGKSVSVIVGAIANRWLRGLYHTLKELPMAA